MLPLSTVEDNAYPGFVRFLEPQCKVPCRKTATDRLDSVEAEPTKVVNNKIVKPSLSREPYSSFTASHITEDWQLVSRKIGDQTFGEAYIGEHHHQFEDDGRQLVYRIQDQQSRPRRRGSTCNKTGSANRWTDVRCSNHKLYLTVTSAMSINKVSSSNISKCVGAASRLLTHFSHYPLAQLEMEQRQTAKDIKGDDAKPLKLVQLELVLRHVQHAYVIRVASRCGIVRSQLSEIEERRHSQHEGRISSAYGRSAASTAVLHEQHCIAVD